MLDRESARVLIIRKQAGSEEVTIPGTPDRGGLEAGGGGSVGRLRRGLPWQLAYWAGRACTCAGEGYRHKPVSAALTRTPG